MLNWLAGVKTVHIPYKGGGPAMTDLVAGQLQLSYLTYTSSNGFICAGRLRALGVTTAKRSPVLPDLPAIAETVPGYDSAVWYGVLAPSGTPADIIARLNREITGALGSSEIKDQLGVQGVDAQPSTPEQFAVFIRAEIVKWAKVIKVSGAKVD